MAKRPCRKKTPGISSPTTAELVNPAYQGASVEDMTRRMLGAYQASQSIEGEINNAIRGGLGAAKGTILSLDGSINSQLAQAMMPVQTVLADIDHSIQSQLTAKIGSVFEKTADSSGVFPTAGSAFSAMYGGGEPGFGLLDPSTMRCDDGQPLPGEIIQKYNQIIYQCAPLLKNGAPGAYVGCVMNLTSNLKITAPCIAAWKALMGNLEAVMGYPNLTDWEPGAGGVVKCRGCNTTQPIPGNPPSVPPVVPGGPAPGPGGGQPGTPNPPTIPGQPPPVIPGYPPGYPTTPGTPPGFPPVIPIPPIEGGPTTPPTYPPVVPPTTPPTPVPVTGQPIPGWTPPPIEVGGPLGLTPEESAKGCIISGVNDTPLIPGMYWKRQVEEGVPFPSIMCPIPTVPLTYPPPTNPPTSGCCPVNVTVNCKDECKPGTETASGVNLWKGQTGDCYVLPKGVPSRGPSDALVYTSDTSGIDLQTLNAKCKPGSSSSGGTPETPVVKETVGDCDLMFPVLAAGILSDPEKLAEFLGFNSSTVAAYLKPVVQGFFKLQTTISSIGACDDPRWGMLSSLQSLMSIVDRWIGAPPEAVTTTMRQATNYLCPVGLPSPPEATAAFYADQINLDTLKCWVKAAGMKWESYSHVVDAQRSKLTPLDLVNLTNRKIIDNQTFFVRMRELGYTKPEEAFQTWQLGQQIPPPSDLVRFMVRDAGDEQVAQTFGTDAEFTEKFSKQIQEWSQAQGIDPQYMQYVWRSHWNIPSPTQLFEFYHRLRYKEGFGGPAKVQDDVRRALIQQDILPYWIDHYLAVSFKPVTRVDARRMYEAGELSDAELRMMYIDMGYSDENADRLMKFAKREKRRKWRNNRVVRDFIAGAISVTELQTLLKAEGVTDEELTEVSLWAKLQQQIAKRRVCNKAYRRRFLLGEFDASKAREVVINQGLDAGVAEVLVSGWECEKATKGKVVPATQLCKWYSEGLIGQAEMYSRLINLNYSSDDAVNLVRECEIRTTQRAQATQKKILAEQVRRQKEIENQNRRIAREAESANSKREANLKRATDAVRRRRRLVTEAGIAYAETTQTDPVDGIEFVAQLVKSVTASGPYPIDDVLQAAVQVAKIKTIENPDDFSSELVGALEKTDF